MKCDGGSDGKLGCVLRKSALRCAVVVVERTASDEVIRLFIREGLVVQEGVHKIRVASCKDVK